MSLLSLQVGLDRPKLLVAIGLGLPEANPRSKVELLCRTTWMGGGGGSIMPSPSPAEQELGQSIVLFKYIKRRGGGGAH